MKGLLLLLVTILLCSVGSAQFYRNPTVNGYITVFDADKYTPLIGANITLMSGGDTLRASTVSRTEGVMRYAQYQCQKQYSDSVTVVVSHVGYKTFSKKYSPWDIQSNINILLISSEVEIAEVMVIGQQIAMVIKGDTTFYNAAAFKTMSKDGFIELVKQLPSVTIKNDKIYASGAEVKRIYVDNLNLFGQNVSNALTDIAAADVKSVKIYDEGVPAGKIGETRRVMNVETDTKREVIKGGNIDLLGGFGFQKDYLNNRSTHHSQELKAYRNTDLNSMQIEVKNSKNDGTKTPRTTPNKKTSIALSHEYHNGDSTAVMSYVTLNRNKSNLTTKNYTDYLPTAEYNKRTNNELSEAMERSQVIEVGNSTSIIGERNAITFDALALLEGVKSLNNDKSEQILDGDRMMTNIHDRDKAKNVTLQGEITYTRTLSERSLLKVVVSNNFSSNNSDNWQIDTVASVAGLRMMLNNDLKAKDNTLSALANFESKINDDWLYEVGYKHKRQHSQSKQLSIDHLDEMRLDSVNSHNYTVNSLSNMITSRIAYKKGKVSGSLNLDGLMYSTARDNYFQHEPFSTRRFYFLSPSLLLSIGKFERQFILMSSLSSGELSAEELRNSLDVSNPSYVRAGNPNLVPSQTSSTTLSYSITDYKKAQTISFMVRGRFTSNYVATKRVLYLDQTYLPQYDYTIQKGSQLNSVENVNGYYVISASADYSRRIAAVKSTLRMRLMYQKTQTPYFLDETLHKSKADDVSFNMTLNTGFSTHIRLELNSLTTVGVYTALNAKRKYINEIVDAKLEARIGKRAFVNVTTLYQYYNNDAAAIKVQNNVLTNAVVGYNFCKDNKLSLSLGVVDIFNNTNFIKNILEADYLKTQATTYLGQYGYLKVGYLF